LKKIIFLITFFIALSCKENTPIPSDSSTRTSIPIKYAQGFLLHQYPTYKLLEVTKAFPNSTDTLRYALIPKTLDSLSRTQLSIAKDIPRIEVPIKTVVVTSTTHIPSLEMLGVGHTLVGFPNLDYVSSSLFRKRIKRNLIKELGSNESINTEVLIDLNPAAVVSFGIEGQNKSLALAEKAGIPILYNGDWVEQDPLGKVEWVKFFGALYNKDERAQELFTQIEADYLKTKKLVSNIAVKPTVVSGAMYKDVWHLPKGDSWAARLIEDAGGNYLWSDTEGTGSIALSIESVLDKAQDAEYWIGPTQFTSYSALKNSNTAYTHFESFASKKVYTFAARKGKTGGLLYYELGPNRPDIVLKDMAHYLHPELFPEYNPYFFSPLED